MRYLVLMLMALSLGLKTYAADMSVGLTKTVSPATAITATASVTVDEAPTPLYFNGSWLSIADYGVPGTPGGDAAKGVVAQQKAYKEAKDHNDVQGKVANSFWSSVQAWAYNNLAVDGIHSFQQSIQRDDKKRITNMDVLRPRLLLVEAELKAGQAVLSKAPLLDAGDAEHGKAFANEADQRTQASARLASNLLYVQRMLGEVAWPDAE